MAAHQIPFWDALCTESFGSSRQVKGIRARSPQHALDSGPALPHRNPLASRFTAAAADLPIEPVLGADLPQRLPHPVPATQMVPSVPRPRQGGRDRPLGRLLPVIFVWIMIAAAAGSPDTAAALSVVFICLLACRVGYGGR